MKKSSVKLICYCVAVTIAIWFISCPPLLAKGRPITLIYGSFDPPSAFFSQAAIRWGDELEAKSNGRIKMKYSWTMGKPGELYDMTKTGIVDFGWSVPVFTPGLFPLIGIVGLPFVLPTAEISTKALNQYQKMGYVDEEHNNVKLVIATALSGDLIITSRKPIRKMEDFKGLKLHAGSPENAKRVQLMGGSTVFIHYPEMYGAFQKKIIDGMVMGYGIMPIFRLQEVTKYALHPPMGSGPVTIIMNKRKWNRLPDDVKQVIDEVSQKHTMAIGKVWDMGVQMGKKSFLEAGGEETFLSPAELKKMSDAVSPMWEHWITGLEKKGLPGRAAVKDFYEILEGLGVEDPAIGYTLD